MKKFIIFVLIVAVGLTAVYFSFFQKSDEEKINARLDQFEQAYVTGDLDGCIKCFDSRSRKAYEGIGTLGSFIGGKKGIFNFNLGSDTIGALFSLGVATGNYQLDFTVKSIEFDGNDRATVVVNMVEQSDTMAPDSNTEETLTMVREKNNWYEFWKNDWYLVEDFNN